MTAPRRDNLLSAPAFPWSGRDERGTSARADRPFEGVESGLGRPDLKVDRDWKGRNWKRRALQPEIGPPLSARNDRRDSRVPVAVRGAVRTRTFSALGGFAQPMYCGEIRIAPLETGQGYVHYPPTA